MIEIRDTPLPGVKVIETRSFDDDRGYFQQVYHREIYLENGIADRFVQDNEAGSHKGVLRGLHYQVGQYGQSKLVRVSRGSVFDVAVDIRPGSPTFGKWFGAVLSGDNHLQLYIPPDLAHGYLCLEDDTIFNYKCGNLYEPKAEGGIIFDDPEIAIDWPDVGMEYLVSEKDLALPSFGKHRQP